MSREQIHDALNLLDEDMIETVDALRDKVSLHGKIFWKRSFPQNKVARKIPWIKYMSVAACLCVAILGAFVWIHYDVNNSGKNSYDGAAGTDVGNKTSEGNTSNDGLTGGAPDQELDGDVPDGAVDGSVSIGEVPSVLVRIDAWQEGGFEGIVAGIVDTDIFAEGTKIKVIFNENISVGVRVEAGIKFEDGEPDKNDFPLGSIVRVQFVKTEHVTDNSSDITESEYIIYAELIALADVVDK